MITIAYVNFWGQEINNVQDWWLSEFVKYNIDNDTKIVNYNENPDILIASCFGNINIIKNINARCKIFFYGENLNRFHPYNNIDLLKSTFDIILGFKYDDINNKILRLPLWVLYYPIYNYTEENNVLKYIQEQYNKNINISNKQNNASLVASHDFGNIRSKIFNEMLKYVSVLCPGRFRHNTSNIGPSCNDKINFIKNTTYNICPENSEFEGYFTEKIFHALEAGCIPIYWAINRPEKDIINENCYCWANVNNDNELGENIKDVIENKQKYIQIDNLFRKEAKYIVNNFYENLKKQIQIKLNLVPNQKIYGITYTSRHFINRFTEIKNQGEICGLFKEFKCFTEEEIDNDFKIKYSNIWNDSRGGGWWIWKVYIILKQLNNINDDDILVYIDGGCDINITSASTETFKEYINLINNNWSGLLRFELTHPEWKYTNKHSIDYFKNKFNINDTKKMIDTNQIMATIMIMRKTKFVMDFFEKVLEILNDDPYLFTDKYNNPGEQHRHDQSIMSMLCKIMTGSIVIPDETYFEEGFGSPKSKNYPFWAMRKRN